MPLNHGQHVVEVVGHAGGKLPDRFHFLGLAQLRFQVQALGNFFHIAMHHAARRNRMERPGQRAAIHLRLVTQLALGRRQAILHDLLDVWRKNRAGIPMPGRNCQLHRRIIEISNRSIVGQFHRRIRVQLREGR